MTGVLLIHGFAGARYEVSPLYDYLKERGYPVAMPLLAGHEGTKADLAKSTYHQWIASADEAYCALRKECSEVAVIGFSMGGLIAVQLYQKYRYLALVTVNTPVYYWNLIKIMENLKSDFRVYAKKYFNSGTDKPVSALVEFEKILKKTKPLFRLLDCPLLVVQTQDDDVVKPKSGEYIFQNATGCREMLRVDRGGHIVLPTDSFAQIADAVLDFLKRAGREEE